MAKTVLIGVVTDLHSPRCHQILDAATMPGKTVALQVSKPKGFKYRSGQYVFVQCSQLGWMEWHPFTLTSAPDDDYLGLQIRASGDWTEAFYNLIQDRLRGRPASDSGFPDIERGLSQTAGAVPGKPKALPFPSLRLDGPHGAPAQRWQNYEVVVLVGAGIGVTPCASILRDILNNMQKDGLQESPTAGEQGARAKSKSCKTQRVFFCWCTRDRDEAQWFKSELESISQIDTAGYLDIDIHITSVESGQPLCNLLKIGQISSHQVHGRDVMTGLQTRFITKFGRPQWPDLLAKAASALPAGQDTVGVFCCGPHTLGKHLGKACKSMSKSDQWPAKFDFHEEQF
eukprot:scaffold153375_cov42-Prasinocladus_malaysianus.AAC.1